MLVACNNPFVHEEDLWLKASGDCEIQTKHHSRRIGTNRHVQIVTELCEARNLLEPLFDDFFRHSQNHSANDNIVISAKVGINSQTDVKKRRYSAANDRLSSGRLVNTSHDAKQSCLPGAVRTY